MARLTFFRRSGMTPSCRRRVGGMIFMSGSKVDHILPLVVSLPSETSSIAPTCAQKTCAVTPDTGGSKGGAWLRFHSTVNHAVDNFYYRLGYWVATHSRVTIGISLLLVILCCFGFANFTVESDGESLNCQSFPQ